LARTSDEKTLSCTNLTPSQRLLCVRQRRTWPTAGTMARLRVLPLWKRFAISLLHCVLLRGLGSIPCSLCKCQPCSKCALVDTQTRSMHLRVCVNVCACAYMCSVQCAVCSVQCAGFVCALYVCMHLSNSTGVNEVRLVRVCVDVCVS